MIFLSLDIFSYEQGFYQLVHECCHACFKKTPTSFLWFEEILCSAASFFFFDKTPQYRQYQENALNKNRKYLFKNDTEINTFIKQNERNYRENERLVYLPSSSISISHVIYDFKPENFNFWVALKLIAQAVNQTTNEIYFPNDILEKAQSMACTEQEITSINFLKKLFV